MDLKKPGDRLCECRARMRPVGLALKNSHKKYGTEPNGELMLIHVCEACEKISINRIAADDNAFVILEVFQASLKLNAGLKSRIFQDGILVLQAAERNLVLTRLFGKSVN